MVPILLVALVSILHVVTMYELSNPLAWSTYLSVAIEIAALSALAGISVKMGKFIYIPFIIVTLIQFLGNLFFAYSFIDETTTSFKDWVDLVGPLFEPMGVEVTNIPAQKRILAFFTGGLLPFISLTFAHMLVVFTNKMRPEEVITPVSVIVDSIVEKQPEIVTEEIKSEDTPITNFSGETTFNKELTQEEIEEISKKASIWEQENTETEEPQPLKLTEDKIAEIEKFLTREEELIVESKGDNFPETKTLRYSKDI